MQERAKLDTAGASNPLPLLMDKSLIEKQQVPKTQLDFFYKPSKHVHLQFILKFKSKGQAHLTSFNSKLNLTISGVPSLESIIRFFLNT